MSEMPPRRRRFWLALNIILPFLIAIAAALLIYGLFFLEAEEGETLQVLAAEATALEASERDAPADCQPRLTQDEEGLHLWLSAACGTLQLHLE